MIATLRATPRTRRVWEREGIRFLRPLDGGRVVACHVCGDVSIPWGCQDGSLVRVLNECPTCAHVQEGLR